MLSEELIDKVVERLVRRIEQGNEYVLKEIGESIKEFGTLTPSQAQELAQILKYGGRYDKIVKRLAEITELNVKDIYKIFEEVAKNDYRFAKQFYEYKSIKYIPYEQNEALKRQIEALAEITAKQYVNISKTRAFARVVNGKIRYTSLAETYQDVIDEAILNVGQGKQNFDSAMRKTIKQLGDSGVKVINEETGEDIVTYGTGRYMRMDSAIRMNLKGGLTHMHEEMQKQIGNEFDANGVEISVHFNPAPDHQEAQGKQFSNEEYEKLQETGVATSYDGEEIDMHLELASGESSLSHRPIGEYNCYHYTFAIVLGVSKPNYSNKELKDIIEQNQKGFEFDGVHYTNYQGTQLQRRIETEIRKTKDTLAIAEASDIQEEVISSKKRLKMLNKKYQDLSRASGLKMKYDRLR